MYGLSFELADIANKIRLISLSPFAAGCSLEL
jgi:hypothetical protein